MLYKSTRGLVFEISFKDAVMMGLASDGGLIIPHEIPNINVNELQDDFKSIALDIFKKFISDIKEKDIKALIDKSYANFDNQEITPVVEFDDQYILELFHGPTYAFKDIALQFLGNLFEYILKERSQTLNVLGATSGDTGSAAIYGLKGKENVKVFILYPETNVSPTQELQMCDIDDENVFPIAINGTFDDCQFIVKEIFKDNEFKAKHNLGSINSINFARILVQTVYYFYAYKKINTRVSFGVPTGNFGDIFAGYLAHRMGLPIDKLILATNENDILYRFVNVGQYFQGSVKKTLSPSMDIQVASNFERYLYYLFDENSKQVRDLMAKFEKQGSLDLPQYLVKVKNDFSAHKVNDEEILQIIKDFYLKHKYIIDPHTACGVFAATRENKKAVCLATAHPAKFESAIQSALGFTPQMPEGLKKLSKLKRKFIQEKNIEKIKSFIEQNARH